MRIQGIHRHFRMMAIAKDFQSHGYTAPNIEHTRPSGIWDKLESLYDLEVLNERENHHMGISNTPSEEAQSAEEQAAIEEETEEGEDNPWRRRDFGLPDEDFEELAFAKRLDSDRESSPEEIEGLSRTRNVIGDEEMRERREEYDKENAGSVRGKGRKATAARATRARGARGSTRSTPATVDDSEEGGEEEGTSTVDDSPQGKGSKKGVSRGASIRRGRRR
jgi:MRG-binding protein